MVGAAPFDFYIRGKWPGHACVFTTVERGPARHSVCASHTTHGWSEAEPDAWKRYAQGHKLTIIYIYNYIQYIHTHTHMCKRGGIDAANK